MNISMNRLLSMVAAAIMMLMSGAALAEDAPSLQEVQDELKKLQEKGGKAAQVAKDFMNSSCMKQLQSSLKGTGKAAKAAKSSM